VREKEFTRDPNRDQPR